MGRGDSEGCAEKTAMSSVLTIEEQLERMEYYANRNIKEANEQLEKVKRIRLALKKNPALSDLYSLLKF